MTKLEAILSGAARRCETRRSPPANGKFQIKVGGRWRQRNSFDRICWDCSYKNSVSVPLEYYDYAIEEPTSQGSNFWSYCPRCGAIGRTNWVGQPRESQPGGWSHGYLRNRRGQSLGNLIVDDAEWRDEPPQEANLPEAEVDAIENSAWANDMADEYADWKLKSARPRPSLQA